MEMTGRPTRQPVGVGVHISVAQPRPRHVVRVGVDDGPGRPELRGVLHLNTSERKNFWSEKWKKWKRTSA